LTQHKLSYDAMRHPEILPLSFEAQTYKTFHLWFEAEIAKTF
jgi:hypothetical protein